MFQDLNHPLVRLNVVKFILNNNFFINNYLYIAIGRID